MTSLPPLPLPLTTLLALAAGAIWLVLLLGRGGFWRVRPDPEVPPPGTWPAVTAVVPARDEAEGISACVAALVGQDYPGMFRVVVVDDDSRDGTAALALAAGAGRPERLRVLAGTPLPPGWTGKLWALSQGVTEAGMPDYLWLTDADIVHAPDTLARLVARAEAGGFDLVSLMVRLRCRSLAEKLMIPAFVFFFRLLYPFAWVNDPGARTAGAAGGCMLIRRPALAAMGGLAAVRSALIDDCTLGAALKRRGPIWLGLARDSDSLRPYPRFRDIWVMIRRCAFTQLRHSWLLLALTVAGMAVTYGAAPVLALAAAAGVVPAAAGLVAAAVWLAMAAAYVPMLRHHGLGPAWAPLLPAVALFYLGATIDSARRHHLGRGGEWKGRIQAATAAPPPATREAGS